MLKAVAAALQQALKFASMNRIEKLAADARVGSLGSVLLIDRSRQFDAEFDAVLLQRNIRDRYVGHSVDKRLFPDERF